MFTALSKALTQLPDPGLRNTVFLSILTSLVAIICLGGLTWFLLGRVAVFDIGWLNDIMSWLGALLVVLGALMFFPGTVAVVSGLFLDRVANAVEARHYPHLPEARELGIAEAVVGGLRLLGLTIVVNANTVARAYRDAVQF